VRTIALSTDLEHPGRICPHDIRPGSDNGHWTRERPGHLGEVGGQLDQSTSDQASKPDCAYRLNEEGKSLIRDIGRIRALVMIPRTLSIMLGKLCR